MEVRNEFVDGHLHPLALVFKLEHLSVHLTKGLDIFL
jgi:hypothetical protein